MLYWNSIYYFLVTRNAKKAKKKEESDQGPEYNELPETDSEKEEGASSTTTSDTDDEGEEEAKTNNTTPVKHNTKSATKRCVKTFILTFIDYFNINEYVLKNRKSNFYQEKNMIYNFSRTDVNNNKKRKAAPPPPNNSPTPARKSPVKRSRKRERPNVFMTRDHFVPSSTNEVVLKSPDEVKTINDFR